MGWLKKVLGAGSGEAIERIGGVVAKISEGHLGKKEAMLAVREIMDRKDARAADEAVAEIGAKERILVAELQQGDNYTKRARPTIVYVGLGAALVDAIGYVDFTMPAQFWPVWAGVAGLWVVGRSAEKVRANGTVGKVASAITGGPPSIL